MFVLDTNVISELRKEKSVSSEAVRQWAATVPANRLYLSAITVLELELGVLGMERKDARQGDLLRRWLVEVIHAFAARTLPFTGTTAVLCAALHVPDRRSERDAMIAATAKEHGYTVVTRNTEDFSGCGVTVLNPWLRV